MSAAAFLKLRLKDLRRRFVTFLPGFGVQFRPLLIRLGAPHNSLLHCDLREPSTNERRRRIRDTVLEPEVSTDAGIRVLGKISHQSRRGRGTAVLS